VLSFSQHGLFLALPVSTPSRVGWLAGISRHSAVFRSENIHRSTTVTLKSNTIDSHDALVIGGGPVGLASAIALRLKGLDVVLAERRNLPFTNACGEGLLPDGVSALNRMGVRLPEAASRPLRGISFHESGKTLDGRFKGDPGVGITRNRLHTALRLRAEELGVDLRWGETVRDLIPDGASLASGSIKSRWLIAADGIYSPVRRRLGLDGPIRNRRTGLRRHYRLQPWSDRVEIWFYGDCEIYVTPTAPDVISVVLLTNEPRLGFDHHLARFPEVAGRLQGCSLASPECGAITLFHRARRVTQGRVALVGDAGISMDAIAGEGLALGFRQAEAIAEAISRQDLQVYARAHARMVRVPALMTRFLLAVHRYPRFRNLLMFSLSRAPSLLDSLMAIHTRTSIPAFRF
jgi:flavin-dependent dehydrogenase